MTTSYDIDVMRREIATIPDVVSDVLDDAGGHVRALAERLAERGDAAPVADRLRRLGVRRDRRRRWRSSGTPARHRHPVHALDLARYHVALPAAGQRRDRALVLGQGRPDHRGGRPGAQVRPPGDRPDQCGRRPAGAGQRRDRCRSTCRRSASPPARRTYVAMLATLLRLAGGAGRADRRRRRAAAKDARAAAGAGRPTLDAVAPTAARGGRGCCSARPGSAFLGAGPNEATARFGAAKLFEGPQQLGCGDQPRGVGARGVLRHRGRATRSSWSTPRGAAHDRGWEILSELRFIGAQACRRRRPACAVRCGPGELMLPLAPGVPEELSPGHRVPSAGPGRLPPGPAGRQAQSTTSPAREPRDEHYATIHRATVGDAGMSHATGPLADVESEAGRVIAAMSERGLAAGCSGGWAWPPMRTVWCRGAAAGRSPTSTS